MPKCVQGGVRRSAGAILPAEAPSVSLPLPPALLPADIGVCQPGIVALPPNTTWIWCNGWQAIHRTQFWLSVQNVSSLGALSSC